MSVGITLNIRYSILIIIQHTVHAAEVSYNQPKLPACPEWNTDGITFANETVVGRELLDLFIDKNNTIYVINEYNEELHIWSVDNVIPTTINLGQSREPWGLFVTINGDIYIGSETDKNIEKWTVNRTEGVVVMNASGSCAGIFVDIANDLYCSLAYKHQVIKQSLYNDSKMPIRVAGNGTKGAAENMLDNPRGIFVTVDFDLYVADSRNHRIQLFKSEKLNGITVTKNMITSSIKLSLPTAVFLDADGYIFIVDNGNNRIIGSRSNGFYCIVGCSSVYGSTSSHLHYPYAAAFDTYGNIYVADQSNNRIQKFILMTNTSHKPSVMESTYSLVLAEDSQKFLCADCDTYEYSYQTIQVNVFENGCYKLLINSTVETYVDVYKDYFKPVIPTNNVFSKPNRAHHGNQFDLQTPLLMNANYILVVATSNLNGTEAISIIVTGPSNASFSRSNASMGLQATYLSELNLKNQTYARTGCGSVNYYYEAIQINVLETGYFMITSNSIIDTYGIIYETTFDVFDSHMNLLLEDDNSAYNNQFKILILLQMNTNYTLIVTTSDRNLTGTFSILLYGSNNVTMNHIDDIPPVFQSTHSSALTTNSEKYARERCKLSKYYYEALQINVMTSGSYILSSDSTMNTYSYIYNGYFNPLNPDESYFTRNDEGCTNNQFKLVLQLRSSATYVLVVTTFAAETTGKFIVFASGPSNVIFKPIGIQSTYTSVLTKDTQTYSRVCGRTNYHYETIQVTVKENSKYRFDTNSTVVIYGYLYKHNFDPFNPTKNLLMQSNYSCGRYYFQFAIELQHQTTYVLVVTTFEPNVRGLFSVFVYGPNNVSLNRTIYDHDHCVVGDRCNSYIKGIGLTLDDILRNEIQRSATLNDQSFLLKMSVTLIMIMFIGGLINSVFSLLTFRNAKLQRVGCGIYLSSSSITSLLTISMLTVKFSFVVLTHMNTSVNRSVLRHGCVYIESILKIFVYFDAWLNACVAVERAVSVSKGIKFNKAKSRRIARWIVIILPVLIIITVVHEPIHRDLLEYTTEKYNWKQDNIVVNESVEYDIGYNASELYETENHILCVTNYHRFVQDYNTAVLFFHLTGPFLANLFSSLYIIFGTARQRSATQTNATYRVHVLKQLSEHKQLIISPIILLILSLPRLIISLVSGCVDASNNPWLYLCAYFISFIPSMLIFLVFIFPSQLYFKTFKETVQAWKPRH